MAMEARVMESSGREGARGERSSERQVGAQLGRVLGHAEELGLCQTSGRGHWRSLAVKRAGLGF